MSIQHFYSQTVADGTATSVVRPSDWNSVHNQVLNIGGNTLGTSQISGADIVWAGGNNVSLSANGSTVTIHGADTTQFLTTAQPPGAYLTTAAVSNHSHNLATTTTNGSVAVVATTNSAGATIAFPSWLTTAGATNAITTAAQSNHSHNFATTTTGGSNIVVGTTNSAGATIGVPAFLTTAAATNITSGRAGTGTTFAGTNASASMTLDTAGLNFALSVAGGGVINQTGPNIAVAGSTVTSGDVYFSNSPTVTFGMNGSTITASAAGGGGGAATVSRWIGPKHVGFSSLTSHTATALNGSLFLGLEQFPLPVSATKIAVVMGHSVQSSYNQSQVMSMTLQLALYSRVNATQLSLASSGSTAITGSWSSSTTTGMNGFREHYVPIDVNASAGQWYVGRLISITGNNASAATAHSISQFGIMGQTAVSAAAEGFGVATNATQPAFVPFAGRYTAATAAFPATIAASQLSYTGTNYVHGQFYREYVA